MPIPKPYKGQVIRYSYLWNGEHRLGHEDGRKDRPCAVILAVESADEETYVTVAPITRTPPNNPDRAVELPGQPKQRLGLDHEQSWVIVDEANYFEWPGPDIRPIPGSNPPRYEYGPLPPGLYKKIVSKMKLMAQLLKLKKVRRTH